VHLNTELKADQAIPVAFTAVSTHPVDVFLNRLAPGSRRGQEQALDTIAKLLTSGCSDARGLDWPSLRYPQTAAVRAVLAQRYAPNTTKRMLAALRGVLKECWRLGLMSHEEVARAVDMAAVKGEMPPRGRALTQEELRDLFKVCEGDISPAGVRDGAILALLYGLGLRRSELTALNRDDYAAEEGRILIRGKGGTVRTGFIVDGTREPLEKWLKLRGIASGPMFMPLSNAGHLVQNRITTESIAQVLAKRAAEANVKPFSCHDCRRSFITHLLDSGAGLATVQKMAGHRQVTTTVLYDRRGEEAQVRAAALIQLPV